MPYRITRHPEQLIWIVVDGHMSMHHAECYLHDVWELLDNSTTPQDLLVDGRQITNADPGARQRTEQVAHHPNLGHVAFVVGDLHLLLLAPLLKLVSGIGLVGDDHAALAYLRSSRGLPPVGDLGLPNLPPRPTDTAAPPTHPTHTSAQTPQPFERSAASPSHMVNAKRFVGDQHPRPRALPLPPATRQKDPPHSAYGHAGSGDEEP